MQFAGWADSDGDGDACWRGEDADHEPADGERSRPLLQELDGLSPEDGEERGVFRAVQGVPPDLDAPGPLVPHLLGLLRVAPQRLRRQGLLNTTTDDPKGPSKGLVVTYF